MPLARNEGLQFEDGRPALPRQDFMSLRHQRFVAFARCEVHSELSDRAAVQSALGAIRTFVWSKRETGVLLTSTLLL